MIHGHSVNYAITKNKGYLSIIDLEILNLIVIELQKRKAFHILKGFFLATQLAFS